MNTESKIAILAILVGFLIRVLKSPSLPAPLSAIPPKARPTIAIVLGCTLSGIESFASGKPAKVAVMEGASAAALAIMGHYLGIDVMRGGRELTLGGLEATAKSDPPLQDASKASTTSTGDTSATGDTTATGDTAATPANDTTPADGSAGQGDKK